MYESEESCISCLILHFLNARYTEDPFCGHDVSIDLWSSLLSNITKLNEGLTFGEMKEVSKVKVLVMGGADDMCTERGKGVHEVEARAPWCLQHRE